MDALFASAQLKEVLSMSDYVVVALPLPPRRA